MYYSLSSFYGINQNAMKLFELIPQATPQFSGFSSGT